MIRGLGCDLCAVARMEEALARPRFAQYCFTEAEQAYISDRARAAQTAAGLFAAKEAFVKALGTGFAALPPAQVEIGHDASGAPEYRLNARAQALLRERGASRALLSISHDGGFAMAVAVLEE